eukprot:COSAG02_NODE_1830_length_10733_cov_38.842580_9_plen_107_part_00
MAKNRERCRLLNGIRILYCTRIHIDSSIAIREYDSSAGITDPEECRIEYGVHRSQKRVNHQMRSLAGLTADSVTDRRERRDGDIRQRERASRDGHGHRLLARLVLH